MLTASANNGRYRVAEWTRFLALTQFVVLGLSLLCSPRSLSAQTSLLGVYYGNQGWAMSDVRNLEAWQNKKHAVLVLFTDWCNNSHEISNLFGQQLPNIWNNGNVPMITWMPQLCSNTPSNIAYSIAGGQYDSYLKTWTAGLKKFLAGPDGIFGNQDDRRVYLRFAHEPNGNWYPWSAADSSNTPDDYINMWHHVWTYFSVAGINDATHIQWVFCANNNDVGVYSMESYFPGTPYVNWMAIDGYNWGGSQSWSSWQLPGDIFGSMLGRLSVVAGSLPLALTEVGSTSNNSGTSDIASKSSWISSLYAYVASSNIRMVCWFNTDKETDWAVFGGTNGDTSYTAGRTTCKAYRAYQTAVQSSNLVPSSGKGRLLSDAQFQGIP